MERSQRARRWSDCGLYRRLVGDVGRHPFQHRELPFSGHGGFVGSFLTTSSHRELGIRHSISITRSIKLWKTDVVDRGDRNASHPQFPTLQAHSPCLFT